MGSIHITVYSHLIQNASFNLNQGNYDLAFIYLISYLSYCGEDTSLIEKQFSNAIHDEEKIYLLRKLFVIVHAKLKEIISNIEKTQQTLTKL